MLSISAIIMLVMTILFLGGLYLTRWVVKLHKLNHLKEQLASAPKPLTPEEVVKAEAEEVLAFNPSLPHKFIGMVVVVPLVVGVVLATFLIKSSAYTTQVTVQRAHKVATDRQGRPVVTFKAPPSFDAGVTPSHNGGMDASPVATMRVVISDDSLETTDAILDKCTLRQAVIIKNKTVTCMSIKQLEKLVNQTVEDHKSLRLSPMESSSGKNLLAPPPLQQTIFAAVAEPSTTTTTKEVPKPWKDRYAEIFYFLALVFGVLGKFYWDYSEEKVATRKEVPFDTHLIAMSFIIACLMYYSIQQGLEKEVSKLSLRGVLFAFNTGFFWQTLLKGIQRRPPATRRPRAVATLLG